MEQESSSWWSIATRICFSAGVSIFVGLSFKTIHDLRIQLSHYEAIMEQQREDDRWFNTILARQSRFHHRLLRRARRGLEDEQSIEEDEN